MGTKGKILISLVLIIIVIIVVWQFSSPALIPSVGTKYLSSSQWANRGSWIVPEDTDYGKIFLVISIANTSYPSLTFQTLYSVIVSKVNESSHSTYVRGLTLKITGLQIQDNYDGSTSIFALPGNFTDAVQAMTLFHFRTSASHQLRFTINYQIYEVLVIGSLADRSSTRSFNVTQNVI